MLINFKYEIIKTIINTKQKKRFTKKKNNNQPQHCYANPKKKPLKTSFERK
jgi:hypothetical protein